MAKKQYKQLGCLDVDPKGGCAFQVRAETEDEVMRLAGEHMQRWRINCPPFHLIWLRRSKAPLRRSLWTPDTVEI